MSRRSLVLLAACLAPVCSIAQTSAHTAPAKSTTLPRTSAGHPDLQGIWSNATLTPFERSNQLAGKEFFTPQEGAEFTRIALERANRDKRGATPQEDVNGAYNEAWFERGTKIYSNLRTSIVVDPADGRIPPLTAQARNDAAARGAITGRRPEGPEDFSLPIRCIVWPTSGPPMIAGPYNNNYQIVQTSDYVAIDVEMIHDMRIVPLNARRHLPASIRQWMGDPVGHWEGDTLVVDTTNFTDKTHFRGADRNLHLMERFKLLDANTIQYRFTVDDPTAFVRPWTGEIILTRTPGPLYEYACHEANYSLLDMLRAARAEEKSAPSKPR
ncbi:MAG TPA: hypothetical protein VEU96_08665 [Bryobacteraceae bacterium]|nr:hypothetical protein [Bryobacteraceae bacterium]